MKCAACDEDRPCGRNPWGELICLRCLQEMAASCLPEVREQIEQEIEDFVEVDD